MKKKDALTESSAPGTAVIPAGPNPLQALLVVLLPQQGNPVDTIMFLSVEEERVFKDEATNLVKRVLEAQAANIDTLESRLPAAKAAVMARLAALSDGHEQAAATDEPPAAPPRTHEGKQEPPAPPTSERKEGQKGFRPGSPIDKTLRLIVAADPEGISTDGIHEALGGKKQTVYSATSKLKGDGLIERNGKGRDALWTATVKGERMCADGELSEQKPPIPAPAKPPKSDGKPARAPSFRGDSKPNIVLQFLVSTGKATTQEIRSGVPATANWKGLNSCLQQLQKRGLVANTAPPGRGNVANYVATDAGKKRWPQTNPPISKANAETGSGQKDRAPRKVGAHELFSVAGRDPKGSKEGDESHLGPRGKAPPPVAPVLSLAVNTNAGSGINDSEIFKRLKPLDLDSDSISATISCCLDNRWIVNSGTEKVPCWKATIKGAEEHKRQLDRVIMFLIDQAHWGIGNSNIWERLDHWGVTLGNVEGITTGWATRKFIEGSRQSWTSTDMGTWSVLHRTKTVHAKATTKRPNPLPPIPERIVPPGPIADWKRLALEVLKGWNWTIRFSELIKYAMTEAKHYGYNLTGKAAAAVENDLQHAVMALGKDKILTANGDEVIRPLKLPTATAEPSSGAAPTPPASPPPVVVTDDRPVVTEPEDIDVTVFAFIGIAKGSVLHEEVVQAFLNNDPSLEGVLPADMPAETRQQRVLWSINRLLQEQQIRQEEGNLQVA